MLSGDPFLNRLLWALFRQEEKKFNKNQIIYKSEKL